MGYKVLALGSGLHKVVDADGNNLTPLNPLGINEAKKLADPMAEQFEKARQRTLVQGQPAAAQQRAGGAARRPDVVERADGSPERTTAAK
jgi:hypothetical protein